jgi:hypothetical protein
MEDSHQYDPEIIIEEANEKYNNNDFDGALNVYLAKIFEWVDDYSFGASDPKIKEGTARLWIESANLQRLAKKFKAATDTFESAVNCPVAGSSGSVWLAYAQFLQERNRNKTAQKIFLRALVGDDQNPAAVSSEGDRQQLWDEFLSMMKRLNSDESLTMDQLKAEVSEHSDNYASRETATAEADNIPLKKPKVEMEPSAESVIQAQVPVAVPQPISKPPSMHTVTSASNVEATANALSAIMEKIPGNIQAEWLVRDGNDLPSRPEPPLFSPSPPKLAEASGKDLLGTEIALQLIRLLIPKSDNDVTGHTILEIIKGCWSMTALKEREAAKCIDALDKRLLENIEKMEAELDARISVAGGALVAVEQMNASERTAFMNQCNQQRQQLQALISWEFRLVSSNEWLLFSLDFLSQMHSHLMLVSVTCATTTNTDLCRCTRLQRTYN